MTHAQLRQQAPLPVTASASASASTSVSVSTLASDGAPRSWCLSLAALAVCGLAVSACGANDTAATADAGRDAALDPRDAALSGDDTGTPRAEDAGPAYEHYPDNHAPIAHDELGVTDARGELDLTLRATDVDFDPLHFEVVGAPAHGTITGSPPSLHYRATDGYVGLDALRFRVDDGALSSEATWSLEVRTPEGPRVERIDGTGTVRATYTTATGATGPLQQCANAAVPGDTCLAYPGSYAEYVQTAVAGTDTGAITFRGLRGARVRGFRLRHAYTRVVGFDITKYVAGLSPAHVTIEPAAHHCTIFANTIHDGAFVNSRDLRFSAATRTITLPSGGFLAAGFEPGVPVYIASNINHLIRNHDTVKMVAAVTDTTLTLAEDETLLDEGPVHSVIYVTRTGKSGVRGMVFNYSSTDGAAHHCDVTANTFSNLGGNALHLAGWNHLVQRNVIEHMNGWQLIDFLGHDNEVRLNVMRSSPRYEGLEPPNGDGPDQTTGLYWDFVTQSFRSLGTPSFDGNDNVFEYNFMLDLDNELMNITERLAGMASPYDAHHFIFRNNVIVNLEFGGAVHRPETYFEHNTMFRAAKYAPTVIAFSNDTPPERSVGDADGSFVRSNVFLDCGNPERPDIAGWYRIVNTTLGAPPDYNYVGGPPMAGFPRRREFTGTEPHGIDGGDPELVDLAMPLGPDGLPFTPDDGLRPRTGSPLCGAAHDGGDVGAYRCVR